MPQTPSLWRWWPAPLGAWLLGIFWQLQQAQRLPTGHWPWVAAGAVLALGVSAGCWALARSARGHALAGALLCLACACAGFAVAEGQAQRRGPAWPADLEGADLTATVQVVGLVQRTPSGWRARVRMQALHGADGQTRQAWPGHWPSEAMVSAHWRGEEDPSAWVGPLPAPGELWRWRVRWGAVHGLRNPGGFDHELWMWEQGLRAQGRLRLGPREPAPQRLATGQGAFLEALRQAVRERLLRRVAVSTEAFDAPDDASERAAVAGVLAALVVGDQAAIARRSWDDFRATGVAHLMSISGLHITLLGSLGAWLCAALWRRAMLATGAWARCLWPAPTVGAWGGWWIAAAYAAFAGWGVPAQRTVWMLLFFTLWRVSPSRWPGPLVWSLAAVWVLSLDPWAALQPGFWLSFVAVGALMACDRAGTSAVHRYAPAPTPVHRWGAWWPRWGAALQAGVRQGLGRLVWEQTVVLLAVTPVGVLFFGQWSWVAWGCNLVAIPWVTWGVTPLALLGAAWAPAWDLAAALLSPLLAGLSALAQWAGPALQRPAPPWPLAVCAVAGGVLALQPWPLAWRVWGVLACGPALVWSPPRPPHGVVGWWALDVGQGSAVLVRTAHHSLLYDAGPRYSPESDAGSRVLVPWLAQQGERLDRLVLSHADSDHVGGAAAVRAAHPQALTLAAWTPADWPAQAPVQPCLAGTRWHWDGVDFEVLHPPMLDPLKKVGNPHSCVLLISAPGGRTLLTGDIGPAQEAQLLAQGLGPVDAVLVPHHGSKNASTLAWVQALQPRVAVAQAGWRNRYGHPAPEVVARYQAQGAQWADSARCGAAHWRSDRPGQLHCTRQAELRYWHHQPPARPAVAPP